MRYELFISLRYLLAKRREKFLSLISLISVLGVAVGVAALIVVIAVMSGFSTELRDKIVGTNSHILIERAGGLDNYRQVLEKIEGMEHVVAASPFVNGQAVLSFEDRACGVLMRGIEPSREARVTKLAQYLVVGGLDFGEDGIVIGSELSRRLGAALGDYIYVVTAVSKRPSPLRVCGIFSSGMYEYDANLSFVDIHKAQEFYGIGELVSGVGVGLDNLDVADRMKLVFRDALGYRFRILTWMDANRNLFSAIRLEKLAMSIILALIVLVACFNIASTLIMTVLEKTKDIGILKSIGASNRSIMAIFTLEGLIIGIVGTALGAAIGLFLCWAQETFEIVRLSRDVYYFDKLPVLVQWSDSLIIMALALVISLLSTVYPAWQAARLNPVEALRYE